MDALDRLAHVLNLAYDRGDLAAIAILEGPRFGSISDIVTVEMPTYDPLVSVPCAALTPREAIACYGRGSFEHHQAIRHQAHCRREHA